MDDSKKWLADNGLVLGNILMSLIGLIFAFGAPAESDFKTLKKWWIVMWAALFLMWPWFAFLPEAGLPLPDSPAPNWTAIISWAVFNGLSTAAVIMLWFYSKPDRQLKNKRVPFILFFGSFVLTALFSYLDSWFHELNLYVTVIAYFFPWISFLLLAWNYRKEMKIALILIAYANLQLPSFLADKTNPEPNAQLLSALADKISLELSAQLISILTPKPSMQLNLVLLVGLKIALLGAMYETLGIKEDPEKKKKIVDTTESNQKDPAHARLSELPEKKDGREGARKRRKPAANR